MGSHLDALMSKPLLYQISRDSLVHTTMLLLLSLLMHRIFVLEGILQILFMVSLSANIRKANKKTDQCLSMGSKLTYTQEWFGNNRNSSLTD